MAIKSRKSEFFILVLFDSSNEVVIEFAATRSAQVDLEWLSKILKFAWSKAVELFVLN